MSAGYDYDEVQSVVNALIAENQIVPSKTLEEISKEVIQGKWDNGEIRRQKLEAAGYNYDKVQNKVNELLR